MIQVIYLHDLFLCICRKSPYKFLYVKFPCSTINAGKLLPSEIDLLEDLGSQEDTFLKSISSLFNKIDFYLKHSV